MKHFTWIFAARACAPAALDAQHAARPDFLSATR
jgi:hypothetical protein